MSNWKYDSVLWTMSILADLFFREVHPRGAWKVPRHGPVLFVAAPHANQVGITSPSFSAGSKLTAGLCRSSSMRSSCNGL